VSYKRVIPRDLFNEANLLKCLGRVALLIHDGKAPEGLRLDHQFPDRGFEIDQAPESGDIHCRNLLLVVPREGRRPQRVHLWRNLNSRENWPLTVTTEVGEETEVLDDEGNFTPEFLVWVA
jgi:hypothetical protein